MLAQFQRLVSVLILSITLFNVTNAGIALPSCDMKHLTGTLGATVRFFEYPYKDRDHYRDLDFVSGGYLSNNYLGTVNDVQDINWSFGDNFSVLPYGFPVPTPNHFLMEITGYFLAPQTGIYNIDEDVDDSGALFMGAGLAFDCCGQPNDYTSSNPIINNALNVPHVPTEIHLEAGLYYPFKQVYINYQGTGRLKLAMTLPDGSSDDTAGRLYSFTETDPSQCAVISHSHKFTTHISTTTATVTHTTSIVTAPTTVSTSTLTTWSNDDNGEVEIIYVVDVPVPVTSTSSSTSVPSSSTPATSSSTPVPSSSTPATSSSTPVPSSSTTATSSSTSIPSSSAAATAATTATTATSPSTSIPSSSAAATTATSSSTSIPSSSTPATSSSTSIPSSSAAATTATTATNATPATITTTSISISTLSTTAPITTSTPSSSYLASTATKATTITSFNGSPETTVTIGADDTTAVETSTRPATTSHILLSTFSSTRVYYGNSTSPMSSSYMISQDGPSPCTATSEGTSSQRPASPDTIQNVSSREPISRTTTGPSPNTASPSSTITNPGSGHIFIPSAPEKEEFSGNRGDGMTDTVIIDELYSSTIITIDQSYSSPNVAITKSLSAYEGVGAINKKWSFTSYLAIVILAFI
ncbi:hypothetical protein MOSE0_J02146 [Monosporozyma servazzii]